MKDRFFLESFVRKLPCKHLFHAKCIEEYFVGRVVQPKCPLCKNNPFVAEQNDGRENFEENQDRSAVELQPHQDVENQ
jgi:hypothetical protein